MAPSSKMQSGPARRSPVPSHHAVRFMMVGQAGVGKSGMYMFIFCILLTPVLAISSYFKFEWLETFCGKTRSLNH